MSDSLIRVPLEETRNRRTHPRSRTLLGGVLVDLAKRRRRDCVIRNISPSGAVITLNSEAAIPQHLILIDAKHAIAYRSVVARRGSKRLGLMFAESYQMDEELPPHLEFLREALREKRIRQTDFLRQRKFANCSN